MNVFVFILCVLALAMLYRLALLALKRRRPDDPAPGEGYPTEEQMVRDLYRGLARMEQRLEALETLLADRAAESRASTADKRP